MSTKPKMTRYRFESLIRSFLNGLLGSAIKTEPDEELKSVGLKKKELINIMMRNGILTRKERILDKSNSDKEKPTYSVKYKVVKKDFNDKIGDMYNKYIIDKDKINECDCGGAMGGDCLGGCDSFSGGATNASSSGQFSTPIGPLLKRDFYNPNPKKKKKGAKRRKRVYMTEEQLSNIQDLLNHKNAGDAFLDETNTSSVGDYTYAVPLGISPNDPAMKRGNGKNGSTSIPKKRSGE